MNIYELLFIDVMTNMIKPTLSICRTDYEHEMTNSDSHPCARQSVRP